MRRSILVLMALMLLLPAAALKANELAWSGVRLIAQGYRNMTTLVETSLGLVNTYHPQPGMAVHITSGLAAWNLEELAIRLTASGGTYVYLLEVWTKRAGVWYKAMEYSYDDASAGQIVFRPYAFSAIYAQGSLHRVEFQNTASQKQMTVYSQHPVAVNNVTFSIGLAREAGDYVDLYVTANLDSSIAGTGANDAYLFGARIAKAAPHPCTAKLGRRDQGDSYDFTFFGTPDTTINNGHFDQNGFVEDGQSNDGIYPLASSVVAANLPSAADLTAASVSFASEADPDF